jgi:hypothetical protein
MQVRSIPQFIDTRNLTITRQASLDEDQLHTQIEAVDPQGDSIVISRKQQPSGPACVMPRTDLIVTYQQAEAAPEKAHRIGSDEAGDLYMALKGAKKGEDIDLMAGEWIMSDLAMQGGIGGAC